MLYDVHPMERVCYAVKVLVSAAVYLLLALFIGNLVYQTAVHGIGPMLSGLFLMVFYALVFAGFLFFRFVLLVGHIKGNAVRVTPAQFPLVFEASVRVAEKIGLKRLPVIYVIQHGGLLNAFAARFWSENLVVIYSDILEAVLENSESCLEFVIAHEFGHIKREHMLKNLALWPGALVPFLQPAYSRGCEYTCDRIAFAVSPGGSWEGLLMLAAGKNLYKDMNMEEYVKNAIRDYGAAAWFAEICSSHPHLPKRLIAFKNLDRNNPV